MVAEDQGVPLVGRAMTSSPMSDAAAPPTIKRAMGTAVSAPPSPDLDHVDLERLGRIHRLLEALALARGLSRSAACWGGRIAR